LIRSKEMAIPDFQSIMLPLLKLSSNGEIHNLHKATEELANKFKLSDEELSILISSGPHKFENRVGWARTYLKKAGLLKYPQRGHFQITPKGIEVLNGNPEKINIDYLKRFPEFLEFRRRAQPEEKEESQEKEDELTPQEAMENAYLKIRSDLIDELLENVLNSSPEFFEKLVVELLVAMGYGGSRKDAARAVGRVGDEGVDGIIDEDRLGLDVIYIQAKRWKRDTKVGSPQIQAFVGALHGHHARKGVFITTADFSKAAYDFITNIETKVVLINGERLANFMIDYGIGISTKTEFKINELDSDYFGEASIE
jgi:restriction system protein